MARTTADILADTLIDWGVEVIFGLPGDGINGVMEALRKRQDQIRFIHVRHEESAAFMACAYAKYAGKLGVCLGTSGPGGIHLLNGLYDAKLDHQPVLAITGIPSTISSARTRSRTWTSIEFSQMLPPIASGLWDRPT
jgi:pyruvate dehydrogenase (quinone)